jgi:dienelactone hydrolase
MAEVTIATARGDLPAYFAIVSSDGPRPGGGVIHDIAGMTPDAPNQAGWLAAEGSWLSHPTRRRGQERQEFFGRPHIDEQLFSWTPHRRQRVLGLASLSRRPIHDRGLQSPRDEEEGETC